MRSPMSPLAPLLKISLASLALMSACGRSTDNAATTSKAPVITGSGNAGVLIAATNVEPSLKTSRVYYYEFASGTLKEILSGESGDPALFWADGRAFLFNRTPEVQSVRTFDPRTLTEKVTTPARALTGITPGDPWDVSPLVAGQSALLASPLGGRLQSFDYASATIADVNETPVRPVALLSAGGKLHILNSGTKDDVISDGKQSVQAATIAGDGVLTFQASVAIKPSNPAGFLDVSGSTAQIAGLCMPTQAGCVAGADSYDTSTKAVKSVSSFDTTSVPYKSHNKIVSGPTATTVYAHVETAAGEFKVIKLDLASKAATAVHKVPDYRLYGIAFDPGSKSLFVGGKENLDGQLIVYRDDQPVGSATLDGIPYSFAFVPN